MLDFLMTYHLAGQSHCLGNVLKILEQRFILAVQPAFVVNVSLSSFPPAAGVKAEGRVAELPIDTFLPVECPNVLEELENGLGNISVLVGAVRFELFRQLSSGLLH